MDPDKIKTIQDFQPPKTKKQVRSFLGFINFYRKYIRDLSLFTEKLSQLTKKDYVWKWDEEQQKTFEQIKKCFLEDIIIKYPNFEQIFFLATDASNTHIGAELYQLDAEGQHRTIGFTSRTLNEAERRYFTTEKELLAIVFACKKYRNYILGHVTNLLTDHQALTFLNSCKLLNARLMRWAIQIQEFNLQIQHIAGKDNVGADMLTRYPQKEEDNMQRHQRIFINQLIVGKYSHALTQQFQNISSLQHNDESLGKIISRLPKEIKLPYQYYNKLLFYVDKKNKHRIMIPDIMINQLINETHEECGHGGASKTYQLLRLDCQFRHMFKKIKRITQSCDICQKSKIYNQNTRGPLISTIPSRPREMVSLDLIGPLPRGQLGAKYILVMLDMFTKYVQIYPIRKATTEIILNRIEKQYLPTCGHFQKILTDNGTQFHSKRWSTRLHSLGIKARHTTNYHPEGNPVERTNREIGRMLRTYCYQKHTNWVQYLKKIEFWINNTTHTTTGYTPQELMGKPRQTLTLRSLINFPEDPEKEETEILIQFAYKRIKHVTQRRNQQHDKNKKFLKYHEGQRILVREHKLSSADDNTIRKLFLLYRGPYVIKQIKGNNTVVIQEGSELNTYNIQHIKPYISNEGAVPFDPGEEK